MKIELDVALCRDFPNLYKNRRKRGTCMVFGLSVGDGWEPIVRELSEKLEKLILEAPEDLRGSYHASQVKEKFGGLRFYMASSTAEMGKAIDEAEEACSKVCESCGAPGSLHQTGWARTNCVACNAAYVNARMSREIAYVAAQTSDDEDSDKE